MENSNKPLFILVDPFQVNLGDLLAVSDSRLNGARIVRVRHAFWGLIDPPLQLHYSVEDIQKFNSIADLKAWLNEEDISGNSKKHTP